MSRNRFRFTGAFTTALVLVGVAVCSIVGGETKPGTSPQVDAPSGDAAGNDADSRPDPQQLEAAQLVQRLGAESYETRNEAAQKLVGLGLTAREALLAGLNASDLEVKRSCRRILADVLEADYERRLQLFINDKDGTAEHHLPGWERYQKVVGEDRPARELFVDMQRAEGALLESYETGADANVFALQTRLAQITSALHGRSGTQQKPSRGTVAALLFVATDETKTLPNDVLENPYWSSIIQQSPLQQTLSNSKRTPEHKLFGIWLLAAGSPALIQRKLQLAIQYGSPEGLQLAIRTADSKDANTAVYRAMGVAGIGQLGGKPYAALLLPMLNDKTTIGQRNMAQNGKNRLMTLELRDVALAWLVHLTDQTQSDYKRPTLEQLFERMDRYPQNALQVYNMYFNSAEERDEAFTKWNKWVAEHPLPKPPQPDGKDEDGKAADQKDNDKKEGEDKNKAARAGQGAAQPAGFVQAAVPVFAGGFIAVPPPVIVQRVALAIPAQAGAAGADNQDDDKEDPQARVERADRQDVQLVRRAARLIEEGQLTDAADMLGQVLEAEKDYTYQPDRGIPLLRGLKIEAEQLVGGMPDKGLEAYREIYEASAERLLSLSVKSGDEQLLIDVMRRYFHTRAGAEATYLLGAHYLNAGQSLRAAYCFDRLRRRSRDYAEYEPALSIKLAVCLSGVGLTAEAEQVLVALKTARPATNIDVAGVRRDLFGDRAQAVAWLEDVTGTSAGDGAVDGWPMYRGNASRNMSVENGNPYLDAPLLSPVIEDPFVARKVKQIQQEMLDHYRAQLPTLHPLVIDNTIVVRSATAIRALDFESGQLLWEVPLVDALRHLVEHHDDASKKQYEEFVEQGLKMRLWEDATFGAMSSDGRLVFGIEETPFGLGGDYRRLVVMPDGRRRLDPGTQKSYNLLTAYDVKTGKIRWEAGGVPGEWAAPLAGAYFLGPPLPMGGRLFVVAELDDEVQLIELEAATGAPLWQMGIVDRETSAIDSNQQLMLAQMGIQQLKRPSHTAGASPSSAGGVLICPLSENEYAAIDLTTRSVIWQYATQQDDLEGALRGGINLAVQKRLLDQAIESEDHWADSSVTIAGDAVLLTPMKSNWLYCLGRDDGRLRWTSPRDDGFYVAGAQDGRVFIVGRGTLRALNLADGAAAWEKSPIPLPPGAVPSGRGYLGEGRYFLPLSSGEVAQFDLKSGELLSRSRAPDSVTPGNLVEHRGKVLSQGVDGLRRFDTIERRLHPLELAVAARGDDPESLADLGESLLYSGQIVEAIRRLSEAHRIQPSVRTSGLLARGLIEALRIDYDQYAEMSREFEPAKDSPEYVWFHKERALALQHAGRHAEAFADLLRLIDVVPEPGKMVRVEFHREVSNGRWITARFDELRREANDVQRAAIDRLLAEDLERRSPEQFLTYFDRHPLADQARLKLVRAAASQQADDKNAKRAALIAEMQLRRLLRGDDPAVRGEATARLVERLLAADRNLEAAPLVADLEGDLAKVACRPDKTGLQLAAAIPSGAEVRRDPLSYWPAGEVEAKPSATNTGVNNTYPVTVHSLGGRYARELSIEIDQAGQKVTAFDAWGRKRLDFTVPQATANYIGGSMYSYSRAFVIGDYAVVWLGNRVCAFDLSQPKGELLWTHETFDMQEVARRPAIAMMFMRLRLPRQVNGAPGGDPLPLAITSDAVFFQKLDKLLALDLVSGELLWSRDGVTENSDVFADGDRLFVQEPGEDEALVLSTLDGRLLGRRDLGDASHRLTAVDGKQLMWRDEPTGKTVELLDVWSGESLWRQTFDAAARLWLVDQNRLAVVSGKSLHVVSVNTGAPLYTAELEFDHPVESIVVTPSFDGYVVALNRSDDKKVNAFGQTLAMTSAEVHGALLGLDGQGKILWKAEPRDQMLRLNHPRLLPVITLLNEMYQREGNRTERYYEIICLESRTGKELYKKNEKNKSNRQMVYEVDLKKHTVDVRTQAGSVTFTFGKKNAL